MRWFAHMRAIGAITIGPPTPALLGALQACLDRLAPESEACVVLCAGKFPPFRSPRPVLLPDRLIAAAVGAVWEGGRLGVIVPIPPQRAAAVAGGGARGPPVAR